MFERLESSAPARVVTTASSAHRRARIPFDDLQAERAYPGLGYVRYGETKLANILFTSELARRLAGTGVTANCFHPGFVDTRFNNSYGVSGVIASDAALNIGGVILLALVFWRLGSFGHRRRSQPVLPQAIARDRE